MLKRLIVFMILLFGVFVLSPAAYADYQWPAVGENPYKGDAEWALQRSSFPHYVNELLRKEIVNGNGVDGKVCGGESLKFVTFGNNGVRYDVLTDWDKTKCYATTEYSVVAGNYSYSFFIVWACGNWAGRVKEVKKEELPPLPEPQEITPVMSPPAKPTKECLDYKYPCRDEGETEKPDSSTPPNNGMPPPDDGDEPTPPDDDTPPPDEGQPGNPGNDKPVGGAGEAPPNGNGEGFGDGERGKSDTKGKGKNK